jgi:flagellar protein FliJ
VSGFRLAALLRLRTMQEDDALAGLGRAQQTLAAAGLASGAAREAVRAAGPAPSGSAAVFLAGAAARAALAVAMSDSAALEDAAGRDVDTARGAWQDARSRSRAVGRLAEKHKEQQQADLARREQAQADELTSARWKGTENTHE